MARQTTGVRRRLGSGKRLPSPAASMWVHGICRPCLRERLPWGKAFVPAHLAKPGTFCCFCGRRKAWALLRISPANVPCGGGHHG